MEREGAHTSPQVKAKEASPQWRVKENFTLREGANLTTTRDTVQQVKGDL